MFVVFCNSMEQIQRTSSHNIRLSTVYDQRQYTISNNMQLSTIYDQLQYTIIYNIRSATTYDYLQYKISDNIRLSTVYDQRQYTIIYSIRSATIYIEADLALFRPPFFSSPCQRQSEILPSLDVCRPLTFSHFNLLL